MRNSAPIYYKYLLNHLSDVPFVGGSIHLGCGYLLRRNETHFIDFFVCIFAPLFTTPNDVDYKHAYGSPCSACDVYKDVRILDPYPTLQIDEKKCAKQFPTLCDVNEDFSKWVCQPLYPSKLNLWCINDLDDRPFDAPPVIYPSLTTHRRQNYQDSCPLLAIYTCIVASMVLIALNLISVYLFYYLELRSV